MANPNKFVYPDGSLLYAPRHLNRKRLARQVAKGSGEWVSETEVRILCPKKIAIFEELARQQQKARECLAAKKRQHLQRSDPAAKREKRRNRRQKSECAAKRAAQARQNNINILSEPREAREAVGRGWNRVAGMSNNASDAYGEGCVPKSQISRELLDSYGFSCTVKKAREFIESGEWLPAEWHHTSKFANQTDFYDLRDLRECLDAEKQLTFWDLDLTL